MTTTTTQSPPQQQQLVTLPIASAANTLTKIFHIIIIANNFRPQKPWKEECKYGPSKQSFQHCSTTLLPPSYDQFPVLLQINEAVFKILLQLTLYAFHRHFLQRRRQQHIHRCFVSSFPRGFKGRARFPFRQLPASPPCSAFSALLNFSQNGFYWCPCGIHDMGTKFDYY